MYVAMGKVFCLLLLFSTETSDVPDICDPYQKQGRLTSNKVIVKIAHLCY